MIASVATLSSTVALNIVEENIVNIFSTNASGKDCKRLMAQCISAASILK